VPLWDWLRKHLAEPGGPAVDLPGRPPWCDPARPNPYRSDGALWLIDASGCALATLVLKDVPGARWEVYRMPKRYTARPASACFGRALRLRRVSAVAH
jgi:hypothetical protein